MKKARAKFPSPRWWGEGGERAAPDHIVTHGAAAPSPRTRGEGWDEGAPRQYKETETRGNAPSPDSRAGRATIDLSPRAGKGDGGAVRSRAFTGLVITPGALP